MTPRLVLLPALPCSLAWTLSCSSSSLPGSSFLQPRLALGQVLLGIGLLPLLGVTEHLLGVARLLALGIPLSPCPQCLPGYLPLKLARAITIGVRPDPRPRLLLGRCSWHRPGPCPLCCLAWVLALGVVRPGSLPLASPQFSPSALLSVQWRSSLCSGAACHRGQRCSASSRGRPGAARRDALLWLFVVADAAALGWLPGALLDTTAWPAPRGVVSDAVLCGCLACHSALLLSGTAVCAAVSASQLIQLPGFVGGGATRLAPGSFTGNAAQ